MRLAASWPALRVVLVRWGVGFVPVLAAVMVMTLAALDADRSRSIELIERGIAANARVIDRNDDGVVVSYDHHVVDAVEADLRGTAGVGATVEIRYDVDDPYRVQLASDALPPDRSSLAIIAAALVGAVSLVVLLIGSSHDRRLLTSSSPTFRMLAVEYRARWSVIPRLSLYALDSGPGDRPVCTVRLADIRASGSKERCVEVDVKGLPRPGGRVVIRRNGVVLWPRGRALLTASHQRPWIVATDAGTRSPWPAPGVFVPGRVSMTEPQRPFQLLVWVGVAAALGVVLTITVAFLTSSRGDEVDRWTASGTKAVATVADRADQDFAVAVDVAVGEPGVVLAMMAPTDLPEDYETGRKYPAIVSVDRSQVRLLADPYDRLEPILWAALSTAVMLWHLARRAIGV